ncbi:hypothetical protein MTO96_006452 [Rhipicephalus appendiculatus]
MQQTLQDQRLEHKCAGAIHVVHGLGAWVRERHFLLPFHHKTIVLSPPTLSARRRQGAPASNAVTWPRLAWAAGRGNAADASDKPRGPPSPSPVSPPLSAVADLNFARPSPRPRRTQSRKSTRSSGRKETTAPREFSRTGPGAASERPAGLAHRHSAGRARVCAPPGHPSRHARCRTASAAAATFAASPQGSTRKEDVVDPRPSGGVRFFGAVSFAATPSWTLHLGEAVALLPTRSKPSRC